MHLLVVVFVRHLRDVFLLSWEIILTIKGDTWSVKLLICWLINLPHECICDLVNKVRELLLRYQKLNNSNNHFSPLYRLCVHMYLSILQQVRHELPFHGMQSSDIVVFSSVGRPALLVNTWMMSAACKPCVPWGSCCKWCNCVGAVQLSWHYSGVSWYIVAVASVLKTGAEEREIKLASNLTRSLWVVWWLDTGYNK